MILNFTEQLAPSYLTGEPRLQEVSEVLELVGSISNFEPEWRANDAGGTDHYEYGGEKQYVPLLFIRKEHEEEIHAYSLNGRFVRSFDIPADLPCEWGRVGAKFRLTTYHSILWL